jgi:triosephosphate isomerase
MRRKFVAGNWKMNTDTAKARDLASQVVAGLAANPAWADKVQVAVCPPFPYLAVAAEAIKGSRVGLGAQNCHHEASGAFTGEGSPAMLKDAGCHYVILGHSERRHKMGETDAQINHKTKAALQHGLTVILCVGETLAERQEQRTLAVLKEQFHHGCHGLSREQMSNVVLAYEPVWAIGTGHNATPEQAQEAHAFLRGRASEEFGPEVASKLQILYGGSLVPDNAAQLLAQPDVDGGLIGGASLDAGRFLKIIEAGAR